MSGTHSVYAVLAHHVDRASVLIVFPTEYDERKRAIEAEERDARLDSPIFVCALAFPGLPTILHVFEPR